jgi:hypothetical protein
MSTQSVNVRSMKWLAKKAVFHQDDIECNADWSVCKRKVNENMSENYSEFAECGWNKHPSLRNEA